MSRLLRLLGATAVLASVGVGAQRADAHPLGNLTSNTAAAIVVSPGQLTIDYVVDLAELPTVQARQTMDRDADGAISSTEADAYRTATCSDLAGGLRVTIGSDRAALASGSSALTFPDGQAGLLTTRLECRLTAPLTIDGRTDLTVDDTNFADRIGWREITVVGDGTTLTTDVPAISPSTALTAYPIGATPLRVEHAEVSVAAGGPRLDPTSGAAPSAGDPQARGADGLTERFQRLVASHRLTAGLFLVTIALSFLLGALHALAPGHGKTMMAAAVVARRGTTRQVLGIGATVTLTHTAGVLALGSVIWLSDVVAPDRVLPWLTVASGVLVAGLGLTMLVRRVVLGRPAHGHHHHGFGHDHHAHDHPAHEHHDHDHDHAHDHHGPEHQPALTRRWVIAMGVAGGLVPTPSALVVLLGATALGRAWLGVVLVGVYGLGMAATLLVAGVAMVRLQSWLEQNWFDRAWLRLSMRLAPVVTAVVLVAGGVSIMIRGALSA